MSTHYSDSWELYKRHTQDFVDDIDFYSRFIGDRPALELFAGYGRVTNRLVERGQQLESVEILDHFAQYISLPFAKNHICDVLTFQPEQKFERIFAAYNSFCLFTDERHIHQLFSKIGSWLKPGGLASMNYYHADYWHEAVDSEFELNGVPVSYHPHFDLSKRKSMKIGYWIDNYIINGRSLEHKYTTRIYESSEDLIPFLSGTGLRIAAEVHNFERDVVTEPGWIDYILEKS